MNECDLRRRYLSIGIECEENECVFWSRLGMGGASQCAIKYFRLLDGSDSEIVSWLMSLKDSQVAELLGIEVPPAE